MRVKDYKQRQRISTSAIFADIDYNQRHTHTQTDRQTEIPLVHLYGNGKS